MKHQSGRVHIPDTLGELRQLLGYHPNARIVSGGSLPIDNPPANQSQTIIALHRLPDLRRLTRSQNALDVGAAVTIERLLTTAGNLLPALLVEALYAVGPPQLRTLATLGGIVATSRMITPPLLALTALDARFESRRRNETRWQPISRLRANGALTLRSMEILTRIRIPLIESHIWLLHFFDAHRYSNSQMVGFCGSARIEEERIAAMRLVVVRPAEGGPRVVRDRAVEATMEGGKPIIEERARVAARTRLTAELDPARYPLAQRRIAGALQRFFAQIARAG